MQHNDIMCAFSDRNPILKRIVHFGSDPATFDRSAGISHLTGQVTQQIEANIDAERDTVLKNLTQVQQVIGEYQVTVLGSHSRDVITVEIGK